MQTVWSYLRAVFLNYCGSVATHSLSHCVLFCNDTVPESEALVAFFFFFVVAIL